MKNTSSESSAQVKAYLAALPPDVRKRMKQMQDIIRDVAPTAIESFSYRMPGFRLNDRVFVYYAAFREHISLYPMTAAIRRVHAEQLSGYKMSTGTIQFPLDKALPAGLVRKLVRARAAEVHARAKKR